jgi:hypothetical protein
MKVRVKSMELGKIRRFETSGEIRDVLINQDFMEPKKVSVSLCFRGNEGSGIIDLYPEEIELINKEVSARKKLFKRAKIIKFNK